ncbi:putative metalloprotease CJM1_0395 family protein [Thiomicrorhabdus sp. zzn3]|uniref:putative metalloprotease CJM1_0395 family protein n=1 Tax=Thiomicrorhabdus sp. zzn3 TaxID=3039775 RepID=UPI002436DEFB|nr:putative metalloprotease CJM1_0395 family protein [Thiomicrorhabdus sp. zzn3]MDG6777240.1 putative metalloprotease CJM1_0395 family protein [Thiomicrorhabdus sp. zzn3]
MDRSQFSPGNTGTVETNTVGNAPSSRTAGTDKSTASNEVSSTQAPDAQSEQNEVQVQQVINQLKLRDREVRTHEQAHLAAAGSYATSSASFVYQQGPDGKRYAVGGEVGIDVSPVAGDPQATIQKAMVVRSAALAPAEPSSQDIKVAAQAVQMMAQARAELAQQSQQSGEEGKSETPESEVSESSRSQDERSAYIAPAGQDGTEKETEATGLVNNSRNAFDLRVAFQNV